MKKSIHLVAFNVPFPPDYGGVIDIFYKLKAFSEAGIEIILHCFEYNRPQNEELEKYCKQVFYYPRKQGFRYFFSARPYIVVTRKSRKLLLNLLSIEAPILFEGMHTTYYLDHPALKGRKKIVRTHNIEHEYYRQLCKAEINPFKKLFFSIESLKLRCFEPKLSFAEHLLSISPNDNYYFDRLFKRSVFIPAFHPFDKIEVQEGTGKYILFHGNISVPENTKAAEFLIRNVLSKLQLPTIIAGKNPSVKLQKMIKKLKHIELISNPGKDRMEELIKESQICLIPTFQPTGLKLKLLASLFSGRHCITNSTMVNKTGLEHLCHLANTPNKMIALCKQLFEIPFTKKEIEERKLVLDGTFSNAENTKRIIELL